jgi:tetratricopeptide (TPR) repeat protein
VPPAARPSPQAFGPVSGQALAAARQLVLTGKYDAGLAALRALKADGDPDVAAFMGLAHRKLGQTDAARDWYDRALAADPYHRLTLSFYGMMHAETGEKDKAVDMLRRLWSVCGGDTCSEFRALYLVVTGSGGS